MIPKTAVEFFFFLLLVAPGVAYELLRERRTPKLNQTAFRELSRVALYSFWFSLSSCGIIALARIFFPTSLFDPGAYIRDGSEKYFKDHYAAVAWIVIFEILIAFALVVLIDRASAVQLPSKIYAKIHKKIYPRLPEALKKFLDALQSDIRNNGLWFELFQAIPKKENKEVLLSIRLSDGSKMSGHFHSSTAYDSFKNAEIAIQRDTHSQMRIIDRQDVIGQVPPYSQKSQPLDDDVIWVRGEDISYIKLRYAEKPQATAT